MFIESFPRDLGSDTCWFTPIVRAKVANFVVHAQATMDATLSVGSNKPSMTYLKCVQDFVYGIAYDTFIKLLVTSCKQPSCLTVQLGVTELLVDIEYKVMARAKNKLWLLLPI